MTLTLILMRHAKSDWSEPGQDDFDRRLNDRGRRAAPLVGRWLADKGHIPEIALVSAARRTVETWDYVAEAFPTVQAKVLKSLYLAGPDAMLRLLRQKRQSSVLVLAHNPGIGECASLLAKTPPQHARFDDYPTGATTILDFDAETWSDVVWHSGTVRDFMVPRDVN